MQIMTGRDTKAEDEWIDHIGNGSILSEMAVTNMVRDTPRFHRVCQTNSYRQRACTRLAQSRDGTMGGRIEAEQKVPTYPWGALSYKIQIYSATVADTQRITDGHVAVGDFMYVVLDLGVPGVRSVSSSR